MDLGSPIPVVVLIIFEFKEDELKKRRRNKNNDRLVTEEEAKQRSHTSDCGCIFSYDKNKKQTAAHKRKMSMIEEEKQNIK